MQSLSVQSGILKNSNNFDWSSLVVAGPVTILVSLHVLSGYNLERAFEEIVDLLKGS